MIKIQIIDKDKKKEAQVLQDISMTPSQRFIRMFDLIEFCITFSKGQKQAVDEFINVIDLKKK